MVWAVWHGATYSWLNIRLQDMMMMYRAGTSSRMTYSWLKCGDRFKDDVLVAQC